MANAANQQIQNILQNQTVQKNDGLLFTEPINGIPIADWNTKKKPILDQALAEKRYANLDALSVATGTAPGGPNAGGAPPAAPILATFTSASQNTYGLMLQKVAKDCSLYTELCKAPFVNNAPNTYAYINYRMQKTTNLESAEQNFKNQWEKATMLNSVQIRPDAVHKWKDFLVHLNQVPAVYRKTPDEVVKKFAFGCHPKIASKAMDMYEENAAIHQIPAVYPALIFPGGPVHPNAGAAMPNAGARDIEKYVTPLSARFEHLIEQGEIVLPNNVDVHAVNDIDGDGGEVFHVEDDSTFLTESVYSLLAQGYTVAEIQHVNRVSRFPRCYNCGGLNHFAKKDGRFVCATPEGSIPKQVLFGIRYPNGVLTGGKGKGKGGRGTQFGRGRGRGARSNPEVNALLTMPPEAEPTPPAPAAPSLSSSPDPTSEANANVVDEFDVEDLYQVSIDD